MSGTPWVSFDGKDCSGCKHLNDRGYCEFTACIIPCTLSATIPMCKPQTNTDRIRAMSDEELADYGCNMGICPPNTSGDICYQKQKLSFLYHLQKI